MDKGANAEMLLGFVGDVMVDRDDPDDVFSEVRDLLKGPDILFANLESPYSENPGMAVTAGVILAPMPHNMDAFAKAGFHVMSAANNHIVDAGHATLLEVLARLKSQGIATCGAGANLEEAHHPAVLERGGQKVGFLAYASVFPHGYQARSTVPGLAPLRAYNHFHEMDAEFYAPGALPRVETLPDPDDHKRLTEDIEALRSRVDLVVTSFHWGDFFRPYVVTDHERRAARLSIDHGASLVLGHHHHTLRGIEWYKNRPIFYGLGHFVFDFRLTMTAELETYFSQLEPDSHAVAPRPGWPLLPLHPDSQMTLLGWARMQHGAIVDVGFVPCRLRPDGRIAAVAPDSSEGREVINYVDLCNRSQKLNGKIVSEGAPVIGSCKSVRVVPIE
jgi:poly-gamma-glutamate synthesis protein (capsule biosynthesis protein)